MCIKILLVTANENETQAILNKKDFFRFEEAIESERVDDNLFYNVGKVNNLKIIHFETLEQGALRPDASFGAILTAIEVWDPDAVILTGIAFGRDSAKKKKNAEPQFIGDILVSTVIYDYESEKIKDGNHISHGNFPNSGRMLKAIFKQCKSTWDYTIDNRKAKIHLGPVLSGDKLVDDKAFKELLFDRFPLAIGGEMEGRGAYSACRRKRIDEWIIVKGIADWGENKSNPNKNEYQKIASESVANLLMKVFSKPNALNKIQKNKVIPQITHLKDDKINIRNAVKEINKELLYTTYPEKYRPDCYTNRGSLSKHFMAFVQSDKKLLILAGKAGFGKSSFLCNLATQDDENTIVLLQNASQLNIGKLELNEYFGKLINPNGSSYDFIHIINDFLVTNQNSIYILVIDSINDHTDKASLLKKLSSFVTKISNQRLKVVISCRMPLWSELSRFLTVPLSTIYNNCVKDSIVEIQQFTNEELETVYNKYYQVFALQTKFNELSWQVKFFLSNPLFLKMTVDVYKKNKKKIPDTLALREVFADYILTVVGDNGYLSEEYIVLQRIIELMYEQSRNDLEIENLKKDSNIGKLIIFDSFSAFKKLIDGNLLSLNINHTIMRKVELLYVTYERIFEYLLAEIKLGIVTVETILANLDLARDKSFIQLRGALELALCFYILQDNANSKILLQLAKTNSPDTRQYIIDVLQTLFDCGNLALVDSIIQKISEVDFDEARILAVQTSYYLGLDKKLISFSLQDDKTLSEMACLYLYERWNFHRKNRNLSKAYSVFYDLQEKINRILPQNSKKVFEVIASIIGFMFVHIIDDPRFVYPIFDFFRKLIEKIPIANFLSSKQNTRFWNLAQNTIIDTLSNTWNSISKSDINIQELINDNESKRAMLDIGELTCLDNLLSVRPELIQLLTWDNLLVSYYAGSLITHHVYFDLEHHLELVYDLIRDDKLNTINKLTSIRALTVGLISRLLNKLKIPCKIEKDLYCIIVDLWTNENLNHIDLTCLNEYETNFVSSWKSTFFSLMLLEGLIQRNSGNIVGSLLVRNLMDNQEFRKPFVITILLEVMEKIAYQGFIEFSTLTIISSEFRAVWEAEAYQTAITALSNCRGMYQNEIDNIFRDHSELESLWNKVRTQHCFPCISYFRDISNHLWGQVFIAIDMKIEKLAGVLFLEIVQSSSSKECTRRMVKTIFEVLKTPKILDVAHYQWSLFHNNKKSRLDKLEISDSIKNELLDLHLHYHELIKGIVKKYGLGILHKDDEKVFTEIKEQL